MKRLSVLPAIIAGCVLFTAASHAGEMKSGGTGHDRMMERCKKEMVDMKMPPTTTKEQNDKMMEQCMQRLQKGQNEKKGAGK